MLFLGSKDMNVYLIDVGKGKLCVVYEGHWNRVTSIYTIPNRDILITISESNIKVWDLEYDECIKNMNEHNSPIVYVSQAPNDTEQVMTIGASFELKIWNYETGVVNQSQEIDIKERKKLKHLSVVCCHVMKNFAFIALNTNEINVYSVEKEEVVLCFTAYNDEQIISVHGLNNEVGETFLIVVTRTSCILYKVNIPTTPGKSEATVDKISAYLINSKKKLKKRKHNKKYNSNFRYYFTASNV